MSAKFGRSCSPRLVLADPAASGDMQRVWERIGWVRSSEISHYRGAAPTSLPNAEPINAIVPPPAPPTYATLIAGDGSQIYPDELAPVHYYLLNIGIYVYYHSLIQGEAPTPEQQTYPKLYFHRDHVHDRGGRIISNRTVDDRRTVGELKRLAQAAWERRSPELPLVALYDNRLLYLPGNDAYDGDDLMSEYLAALVHMHDAGATLAGYVDNPFRAKRFIQLLFLMSIESEAELKARLQAEITLFMSLARCGRPAPQTSSIGIIKITRLTTTKKLSLSLDICLRTRVSRCCPPPRPRA